LNYLAHSYLSDQKTDLIIGNFIADSIRGNQYTHLPINIVKGILLHRKIDVFTDSHPLFIKSKRRFVPYFDKYSSILTDIIYDHLLASNFSKYCQNDLDTYSKQIYSVIQTNFEYVPEDGKRFYNYMTQNHVLYNYQFIEGIKTVLEHFSSHRIKNRYQLADCIPILQDNYDFFLIEFYDFFEEIINYCKKQPELLEN
jgi:acyl carrier protein phosphodiesterase